MSDQSLSPVGGHRADRPALSDYAKAKRADPVLFVAGSAFGSSRSGNWLFPDLGCLWDQAGASLAFLRGVTETARAMTAIMNGP